MPHYSQKLKAKIENQKAQIETLREGLKSLVAYCQSDKYSGAMATMNPDDVVLRAHEILSIADGHEFGLWSHNEGSES